MKELRELLLEIGYSNLKETCSEIRARPIYRDSDNNNSLCIYKKTNTWVDFGTGEKGTIKSLISKTLDINELDTGKYINDYVPIYSYNLSSIYAKTFPKDYIEIETDVNGLNYWKNRGISKLTLAKLGGGVCSNGKMYKRYVFPIYNEENKIIGFSGRDLTLNSSRPKWKHIGDKKFWCYPLDIARSEILKKRSVILVESIGDCLALFEAGIYNVFVLFGVSMNKSILGYILKLDVEKVFISLNNDLDNNLTGNKASDKIKESLLKYFDDKNVIISLPNEKDINVQLIKNKDFIYRMYD